MYNHNARKKLQDVAKTGSTEENRKHRRKPNAPKGEPDKTERTEKDRKSRRRPEATRQETAEETRRKGDERTKKTRDRSHERA